MARLPLVLLLVLLIPAASAADVTIRGFSYSPARLEVDPGATVSVVNEDAAPHSVFHPSFDSGILDQGEAGSFTAPSQPGEYGYVCGVHPSSMSGTLVVRGESSPATPTPAGTPPTATSPPAASPPATSPAATSPIGTSPVGTSPVATSPAATSPAASSPAATQPADGETAAAPGPGLAALALALAVALVVARRR